MNIIKYYCIINNINGINQQAKSLISVCSRCIFRDISHGIIQRFIDIGPTYRTAAYNDTRNRIKRVLEFYKKNYSTPFLSRVLEYSWQPYKWQTDRQTYVRKGYNIKCGLLGRAA